MALVPRRGPHRIVNFQGELDLAVQLLQLLLHGRFWGQERTQYLGLSGAEGAAWPGPPHPTNSRDPVVRAGRGPAPAPLWRQERAPRWLSLLPASDLAPHLSSSPPSGRVGILLTASGFVPPSRACGVTPLSPAPDCRPAAPPRPLPSSVWWGTRSHCEGDPHRVLETGEGRESGPPRPGLGSHLK